MCQLAVPKNGTEDFDRLEKLAEVSCVRLPPPHWVAPRRFSASGGRHPRAGANARFCARACTPTAVNRLS